jgi:hypothetical protein
MTPTEVRIRLLRAGFHPLPLNGKNPNIRKEWHKGFELNEGEIKLWGTMWPNANNTGVLCRPTPFLDIDIYNPEAAADVEALVAERFDGQYVLPRIGEWPKRAIPFKTNTPFKKITVVLIPPNAAALPKKQREQKIEFLCDGQQCVVDGIHPDTGKPYHWPHGALDQFVRDDLPGIDGAQAQQLVKDIVTLLTTKHGYCRKDDSTTKDGGKASDEPQAPIEKIAAALTVIPNNGSWDDWNSMGMAIFRATGGAEAGFALFDAWSKKSAKYDACNTAAKWAAYFKSPPTQIGAGTIFYLADQASPTWLQDCELAELNRDNAVVLDGGKAWVLRFEQVTHNLNGRRYSYRVPIYLRTGDFRTLYMNRCVKIDDDVVELGKWWLRHPARRQFLGLVFRPGGEPVVEDRLNLWTGWGVEPKQGDWSLMQKHIFEVLAARDEAVYAYIINWLAWAVQHPDQQPETALVFLGKRGSGRGTLGNVICRIFGNHGLQITSPQHLVGRFNAHLRQCAFLFADEAYVVDDRSAEGKLKGLITEATIPLEAKGRDVITVPNHLHVMLASNEDWVVPAGEIERRFVVQEVANDHAQDAAWFKPLYKLLYAGGTEAMLFDLLHHDLGDWHPRQIVRTAALAAQQAESLSPFDAWWEDLLHDGYLPAGDADGRVISGDYQVRKSAGFHSDDSKRTWFEKRKGLFEQARTSSPGLKRQTDAAFGRYLRDRKCVRKRVCRKKGWQIQPLDKCRAKWKERFPDTVWDQPDITVWQGERDDDGED